MTRQLPIKEGKETPPRNIKSALLPLIAAFLLGFLSTFAMSPWDFPPVLFVTFSGLYLLLSRGSKTRPSFFCAFAFGFGYFLFGLLWIANALLVEGNEYAWAYPLAVAVLPAILAFFPALALTFWRKFYSPEKLSGFLGFAALLGLSEWLRGHIFTGFPWNLYGYTWIGFLPVAQIAAIADAYLLTFLTIVWCAAPGFLLWYKAGRLAKAVTALTIVATFLMSALYGGGKLQIETGSRQDISIVLVQPNIPQSEKWEPELFAAHFNKHLDLTESQGRSAGPDVKTTYVIWPETAIPLAFTHHPDAASMIAQSLSYFPEKTYLLAGAITRPDKKSGQQAPYYNSLVIYNQKGKLLDKYDKFHLVPFGEYIPYEETLNLTPITGFGGFGKGSGPKTLSVEPDFFFSPLVCYEIIFPGEVTENNGEHEKPGAIINVTNDGWYGISAGPYQHLTQARFRAIEEGIPVIRVANTGFSGVIDGHGKLLEITDLYAEDARRMYLPKNTRTKKTILYLSIIVLFATLTLSALCKRMKQ